MTPQVFLSTKSAYFDENGELIGPSFGIGTISADRIKLEHETRGHPPQNIFPGRSAKRVNRIKRRIPGCTTP